MNNKELLLLAKKGDKAARDRLVQENTGLVWSIVRRFSGRGTETEDLFQIGCIGLIKAVDKFDESFQVQFSTYAVPLIMGEIKRFMRDDGMVKISRTVKENYRKIKKNADLLCQRLGREPTMDELVRETGISPEDITLALEAALEVESLYKPVYQKDGSETYLIDQLDDWSGNGGEIEQLVDNIVLEQVITELDDMEKRIIVMRYFKEKTQTEIADLLGISQVQVSRMEKKILLNMRKKIL